MIEDSLGVVVVLAVAGVAGAPSAAFDRPPTLGGSVASGDGAALLVGNASVDAWPPASPVARDGAAGMLMAAGAGIGVVWLDFLFFLFFFSSFFSSASLERKEGREVRKKVSKVFKPV
jgi:hypothetical protein